MIIPSVTCNTLCNVCSVYLAEHMFPLTVMLPLTSSLGKYKTPTGIWERVSTLHFCYVWDLCNHGVPFICKILWPLMVQDTVHVSCLQHRQDMSTWLHVALMTSVGDLQNIWKQTVNMAERLQFVNRNIYIYTWIRM